MRPGCDGGLAHRHGHTDGDHRTSFVLLVIVRGSTELTGRRKGVRKVRGLPVGMLCHERLAASAVSAVL
jgi:hypothetical protein